MLCLTYPQIKYLTLYTAYCKNHAAAASRLQELEKNSKVSAFLKAQKEAAGKGLDLASLLIMPVQVRAVPVALACCARCA